MDKWGEGIGGAVIIIVAPQSCKRPKSNLKKQPIKSTIYNIWYFSPIISRINQLIRRCDMTNKAKRWTKPTYETIRLGFEITMYFKHD